MRLLSHLSYANVIATLALFLALGGTAVAGTRMLLTGADIQDHSLTGVDLKNGSVGTSVFKKSALRALAGPKGARGATGSSGATGAAGPAGPAGAAGSKGPAGAGVATTTVAGADQANYVNDSPLASTTLSGSGDYVIFTNLTVANTGAVDEYLNCGYRFNGVLNGASGVSTTAGTTASGTSAGVITADGPTTVEFLCEGSGATTFDVSNVTMRVHFLG